MMTLASMGAQIRDARRARHYSAAQLAERTAVHRNTVYAIESGRGNVELTTLLALCKGLDLDIALLPQHAAEAVEADDRRVPTALQARLAALRTPAAPVVLKTPRPPKNADAP